MSPRGVKKEVEVVEEQPVDQEHTGSEIEDAAAEEDATALQEFNEHIQTLVQNFVQQETSGLDERIRDLEGLVQVLIGKTGAAQADPSAKVGVLHDIPEYVHPPLREDDYIPEYVQEHQQDGDGTPWYRG
jgi:hypothetical protein